jgi:plasmid stabilization system protein ParE
MNFLFHPKAEDEFNNSIDYYEDCQQNLGLEFASEVYKVIQRIIDFPNSCQILSNKSRRCIINRFPFGVIYYQKDNHIIILAIMQLNKQPDYWKNRLA